MDTQQPTEEDLRAAALEQLKKRSDFRAHLFAYTVVNTFVVLVWAFTGAGYFWPIFLILGWGIGLLFNAWDVYWRAAPTQDQIRREMDRQRGRIDQPPFGSSQLGS